MNVCTRRLDWRQHPPHDGDTCGCVPEVGLTDEEIRQGHVEDAIDELVDQLGHFTVTDLQRVRGLIQAEIQRKTLGSVR